MSENEWTNTSAFKETLTNEVELSCRDVSATNEMCPNWRIQL